jgi:hypothetical protein
LFTEERLLLDELEDDFDELEELEELDEPARELELEPGLDPAAHVSPVEWSKKINIKLK